MNMDKPANGNGDGKNHEEKARAAYQKFTSREGAAVKELYSYYIGMRSWAGIVKESSADNKIMGDFKKLFASYDKEVEVELWKTMNALWITNSTTIPSRAEKHALLERVNTIKASTEIVEVEAFSRRMLADHVIVKPQVARDVEGAEHYDYFVKNLVERSRRFDDYKGNDYGWWLVYDVLQNSWLKNVQNHEQEQREGLERMRDRSPPLPPEIRKPAPVPEVPAMEIPHPAPPPLPAAFRKDNIANGTVVVPIPPLPAEEMLREEKLADMDFEGWIKENLKPWQKLKTLPEDMFVVFEGETLNRGIEKAAMEARKIPGNEERARENMIFKSIMAEIDAAVSKDHEAWSRYSSLSSQGMIAARHVNWEAQQEAILMAGLIAAEDLMDKRSHKDAMEYLNARIMAIKGGFTVLFDLESKIYVVRKADEPAA